MSLADYNARRRAEDPDLAKLTPGEVRFWDFPAGLPYGYCQKCGMLVDVLYESGGAYRCARCREA